MLLKHAVAFLLFSTLTFAAVVKFRVNDPSSAPIPGISLTVRQPGQTAETTLNTDGTGVATVTLPNGVYTVRVDRPPFEAYEQTVEVKGDAEIVITLKLAAVETSLDVDARISRLANSDPNYRALRDSAPANAYPVNELVLKRDAGTITLHRGTVSFLPPVLRRSAVAVFTGEGSFHLETPMPLEREHIRGVLKKDAIDEDFDSAVFVFTDKTMVDVATQAGVPVPAAAADVLKRYRSHMRRRIETPRSRMEAMFFGGEVPNVEAEVLAELYNPSQQGSFRAFIHGRKYSDLRFIFNPSGALPDLPSPEEVAVVNIDPLGELDGIWYLCHTLPELESGTASNAEVKRVVDAEHYKIETAIGKNLHLAAVADITLRARRNGVRMAAFGLLPNLRVNRVSIGGKDIAYLQESRKADGSFHVILPEALRTDVPVTVRVEYEGNRVIEDEGGGNYAVGARTSWYPSLNYFQQQATYELTFKVPKNMTLVSVGQLVRESREGDALVTEWKTPTPVAVAGFNYGLFQRKTAKDDVTHYAFETYATREAPDSIRSLNVPFSMSPTAMADQALVDAQNAVRVFTNWFGPAPYGRIAITQQPQFFFGQSWPTLVYLPVSAFLDSTQRHALLGQNSFRFSEFIQEVTPHEIAHQWWGHMLGWASYRDQWLSEGFADFSAAIFLLHTEKTQDKYIEYWKRAQKSILEKNEFGLSANDAGPIYMGFRINTPRNPRAYNRLIYSKGGYVLNMLRTLMYDSRTADKDFIEMMQDFVKSSLYQTASLETLVQCVDRHLKPSLDSGDNTRSSAWFFRQWVMGTDIPKYRLEYSLSPADGGTTLLTARLTQSGVSDSFFMRVPLYVEIDGKMIRLGLMGAVGNSTSPDIKVKLPKKPKRVVVNAHYDVLAAESVSKEI